jgi:TP901-1 family phage major tail protein
MTAVVGRKVIVRSGETAGSVTPIAAGRTKSLTINAEPIDITSDDDSGVRTLLETDAGQTSVDMSFEGITKNDNFISAIISGNYVDHYEIEIEGIGTLTGKFFLASVAINAAYNEATTFSAEFQSTGAIAYASAP